MNQHQVTVTRGDDRTLSFTFDEDLTGATARLVVDGLLTRAGVVTVTPGVGDTPASTAITFAITGDDTDVVRDVRLAYRYDVELTLASGVRTARRGLFVVVPDVYPV